MRVNHIYVHRMRNSSSQQRFKTPHVFWGRSRFNCEALDAIFAHLDAPGLFAALRGAIAYCFAINVVLNISNLQHSALASCPMLFLAL